MAGKKKKHLFLLVLCWHSYTEHFFSSPNTKASLMSPGQRETLGCQSCKLVILSFSFKIHFSFTFNVLALELQHFYENKSCCRGCSLLGAARFCSWLLRGQEEKFQGSVHREQRSGAGSPPVCQGVSWALWSCQSCPGHVLCPEGGRDVPHSWGG